jgi:hypothetical protein
MCLTTVRTNSSALVLTTVLSLDNPTPMKNNLIRQSFKDLAKVENLTIKVKNHLLNSKKVRFFNLYRSLNLQKKFLSETQLWDCKANLGLSNHKSFNLVARFQRRERLDPLHRMKSSIQSAIRAETRPIYVSSFQQKLKKNHQARCPCSSLIRVCTFMKNQIKLLN